MAYNSGECGRQRRFIAQVIASTAKSTQQLVDYLNTETEKLVSIPDHAIQSTIYTVWGELSRDERFVLNQRYRVYGGYGKYAKTYVEIGKAFPGIKNPANVKRIKREAMAKLHPLLIEIVKNLHD